jgi:short-subunit dehydrogenase
MRIDGKVVLITGASEGIGAACAAEFARAGARLSLTARNEDGLRRAGGPDALVTPGDITDSEARARVVDRTLERYGRIDVLINNAGVGFYVPSWRAPMADARRMWEVNYFALLGMIQLVVPHMRERREGTIVNVGSIGGKMTLPWLTVYSSSKYAVGSLTEGLRMELLRDNVHAMLVCPGYVQTGFQRNVLGGEPPSDIQRSRKMAITPEQCALDIRRGVERRARTVLSPKSGWFLVMLYRLFPGEAQRRMAGMLDPA